MAGGHGWGGWCAVFVGDGSSHRDGSAQRRRGMFPLPKTPLKSPLVRRAVLSSNLAPPGGMRNSFAFDEPFWIDIAHLARRSIGS